MQALAPVVFLLLFSFLIYRLPFFRVPGLRPWFIPVVFYLKVLAGIGLFLVYTNFYTYRNTSDAFRYYDDAEVMFSAPSGDYWRMLTGIGSEAQEFDKYYDKMNNWNLGKSYNFYNDNRAITRMLAFIMLFSFGSYHVHTLVMCFLALAGLTALYRFFVRSGLRSSPWLFCAVFLAPSVMFWGSGVLKEAPLLFGLGVFLYAWSGLLGKEKMVRNLLLCLLSVAVMVMIKVYVLFLMLPVLIAFSLCTGTKRTSVPLIYTSCLVLFGLSFFLMRFIPGIPDPVRVITEKQNDFYLLARGGTYVVSSVGDTLYFPLQGKENIRLEESGAGDRYLIEKGTMGYFWKGKREAGAYVASGDETYELLLKLTYTGSRLETGMLEANIPSWLKAMPAAFVNPLFRPLPWESSNLFMGAAALENVLLCLLLVLGAWYGKWKLSDRKAQNFLFFCLTFFILLILLTGLVTPVMGALVRYRMPVLPFILAALYLVLDNGRISGAFLRKWS